MATIQNRNKRKEVDEFVSTFMAEQQKLADAAGVHLLVYMAQAQGGILKETIVKMLKHARAHQDGCTPDCEYEASSEQLKEKYGVE